MKEEQDEQAEVRKQEDKIVGWVFMFTTEMNITRTNVQNVLKRLQ